MLVGQTSANRSNKAWLQVYRALQHGYAREQCERSNQVSFPREIKQFAEHFVKMQKLRHTADYNPGASFLKSDVTFAIDETEAIIAQFKKVQTTDRRAFAVYVLLPRRQS